MSSPTKLSRIVRESDLAALVGLPAPQLRDVVACLVPSKTRFGERWYWWRDIEGFLDSKQLAAARKALRELRMRPHGSKYWIAGYPHLVAQWHPTANGELMPDEVRYGSARMIWWKCAEGPDHEWRAVACSRVAGRGCPFCAGKRASVTNSVATRAPRLAREWHPTRNGALTPRDVTLGSARPVWWKCSKAPDHEWQVSPAGRIGDGTGCPQCSGRRASSTNNLAASHPALARQWHPSNNGALRPRDVTFGSTRAIWWRCPRDRRHEWRAPPNARTNNDTGCPFCAGQRVDATNCLATRYPAVARQWHARRNGQLTPRVVHAHSERRIWWRCDEGHVWRARVEDRTRLGSGCPRCFNARRRAGLVRPARAMLRSRA